MTVYNSNKSIHNILRNIAAGLSPWGPGFNLRTVHVGFFMRNMALGTGFLPVLRFSPVSTIPSVLYIRLHLMLLLSEGQAGQDWEPSNKVMILFFGNRGKIDGKVLKFSEGYTAILQ
jgi:hypothetical protein